jgi:hypothetical protein
MDEDTICKALDILKGRPCPVPAGNFQESVWRRIRQRHRQEEQRNWMDDWLWMALRPRYAAVMLGVTLLISIGLGGSGGQSPAHASLGLDVFSADAPLMPATLISSHP